MKKLLEHAEPGDTVLVWRVDRLGESLIDVRNTVNFLLVTHQYSATNPTSS